MTRLFRGVVVSIASLPAVYVAFFGIVWLYTLALNFFVEGPPVGYFFYHRFTIWSLFLTSLTAGAGLIIVAMVHVIFSKRLDPGTKGVWLLLLVIGNIIALPVYCYLNIWPQSSFHLVGPPNKSLDRSHGQRASHHHWPGAAAR
jgi:hypothetical protein